MKKLNYEKFMEREVVHAPYERELSFYEWVKQGWRYGLARMSL